MKKTLVALFAAVILARAQAPNTDIQYRLGPDSLEQEGVPRGRINGPFTLPSQVYPGTSHTYWVYVPAQYDPATPASLMIFNDGQAFMAPQGDARAQNVMDNLIFRREIPVMIGVFINPGRGPDQPEPTPRDWGDRNTNRPTEYNTLDDRYPRVVVEELLPALYKEYNISKDPERHGIGGASSGAIAAFTVAWERADHFRKVLSIVGSFVNLRGGHVYPEIVRKSKKKPIRVFLQDGRNDNRGVRPDGKYDETRDWFFQNVRLMKALTEKGYEVNYTWGIGRHGQKQGGAIMPEMMRWLWRDQPVSVDPSDSVERSFRQPVPPAVVAGIPVNYDEARVGSYTLPDPLVLLSGQPVGDRKTWFEKRRPEIVRLFEENQFGRGPGRPASMSFDVFDKGTPAFDGKAIRRQVTVYFSADKNGPKMDLLIYLPAGARKPVPLLLNLSFTANSNVVDDPGVKPGEIWNREKKRVPAAGGRAFGRLNLAPFLEQGIGVASVYYGDIDPDFAGGVPLGVRGLYLKPGQTEPAPNEWGSIAAWAWGLSRAMDYLETDNGVDAGKVAILGVSRLGKTVLWAGANDPRFAMVIASCSGEGGAALSRRNYGETVKHLAVRYGYQFGGNYQNHGDHPEKMPVDAHMLLSLLAPRPVLLQTGDRDFWSDPKGELLAAQAAEPVYRLLGKEPIAYHMHQGGHGTIPSDWDQFLKFMRTHLSAP